MTGEKEGMCIRPNLYTSNKIFFHFKKPSAQNAVNIRDYQDLARCFGFIGKVIADVENSRMFHICFTEKTKESQNFF